MDILKNLKSIRLLNAFLLSQHLDSQSTGEITTEFFTSGIFSFLKTVLSREEFVKLEKRMTGVMSIDSSLACILHYVENIPNFVYLLDNYLIEKYLDLRDKML